MIARSTSDVSATTKISEPTNESNQVDRRKRTVMTYSGPSGHPTPIRTSAPNTTIMPRVDMRRPSQTAPPAEPSCVVLVSPMTAGAMVTAAAGSTVAVGSVVSVSAASFWTTNVVVAVAMARPSPSDNVQVSTHDPFGNGVGTGTVND